MNPSEKTGRFYTLIDLPDGIQDLDTLKAFDAGVCKHVAKSFIRKIHPIERLVAPKGLQGEVANYNGVIIEEIREGIRSKVYVQDVKMMGNG
jgi:hypothetical protein